MKTNVISFDEYRKQKFLYEIRKAREYLAMPDWEKMAHGGLEEFMKKNKYEDRK